MVTTSSTATSGRLPASRRGNSRYTGSLVITLSRDWLYWAFHWPSGGPSFCTASQVLLFPILCCGSHTRDNRGVLWLQNHINWLDSQYYTTQSARVWLCMHARVCGRVSTPASVSLLLCGMQYQPLVCVCERGCMNTGDLQVCVPFWESRTGKDGDR